MHRSCGYKRNAQSRPHLQQCPLWRTLMDNVGLKEAGGQRWFLFKMWDEVVDTFWRVGGQKCVLITYNAEWRKCGLDSAKRVCLLWTNGVACRISKQRMLGPSSHQLLQPHLTNCAPEGFRMEQNRIHWPESVGVHQNDFNDSKPLASSPTESVKVKFTQSYLTLVTP